MHAVDIRPNLDLLRTDGSSDNRGRIIRSAPQQVVDIAICIAADETLCDIHILFASCPKLFLQVLLDVLEIRLGILVDAHEVKRRHETDFDVLLLQVEVHQVRRNQFALCHDALLLVDGEGAVCKRTDIFKNALDDTACLLLVLLIAVEFGDHFVVLLLEAHNHLARAYRILQTIVARDLKQRVRCSRHSRQHNNFRLAILDNEFSYILDTLSRSDRRPSKLENLHILF